MVFFLLKSYYEMLREKRIKRTRDFYEKNYIVKENVIIIKKTADWGTTVHYYIGKNNTLAQLIVYWIWNQKVGWFESYFLQTIYKRVYVRW